jgi:hypothetical protein
MNEYDIYDDDYVENSNNIMTGNSTNDLLQFNTELRHPEVDFDDPTISSLPRILLMGPRRGGKTSIQVRMGDILLAERCKTNCSPGKIAC